jgi:polysaccharide biosynthesis PFTS motif protein
MKFHFFSKFFKRYGYHCLMRIMRGYRHLKDSKSLSRITDINRALTILSLDIKVKRCSKWIFGEGIGQAEIVCRQYLLTRVAGLNLNRVLLYALGKPGSPVVYYLPPDWRKIIRNRGFKVASLRTALLWNAFVGIMLAYGIFKIAKIILIGIKAALTQSKQQLGRYVYFDSLTPGNLPQPCRDGSSHDIITWYMQWRGRIVNIDTLCHGVIGAEHRAVDGTPVITVPSAIPSLTRFGSLMRFIAWGFGATLIATWDFLRGRWWHALLLNQAALAAQVRMQNPKGLAKDYLFHNSGWIYRPLWTYEAEKRGSRITFYFYSTNCEAFKQPEGYPPLPYGWQAMNWPHYLVWNEYQADFVRRAVGETVNIGVVGQIWFSTSVVEMPTFRGRGVAVFDITPTRSSFYRSLGIELEFYVPETCITFLCDIQKVTKGAGYTMLWKRKRKLKKESSFAHPSYLSFAERLSRYENVISVDPDISANRVIEASTLVISMPFTSTALIARELCKPSCYYDPTGLIQKDDRAAHGIEIIRGPEELASWLKGIPIEPHISGTIIN